MLRLVVFDMDGTLVDVDSSWAAVHRHFDDHNTEGLTAFLENRIDDAEFVRTDIRIWWKHRPGITTREIGEILSTVPLMPGARALFDGLHRRGIRTAIVSGGIDLLAERIARELGIDDVRANGFVTDADGRLSGEGIVRVPIWGKEEVVKELQAEVGVTPEATASVGNSEIDVGMFRRSKVRIAYRPVDEAVRRHAHRVVEDGGLDALLGPLTQ